MKNAIGVGLHRPSQITFYGMTGGPERWLKTPLDLSQSPVTFALQAHEFVRKTPFAPYHRRTTGFIVNYTPDSAVRFDRDGNPVEHCVYFRTGGGVHRQAKATGERTVWNLGRSLD